MLMRNQTLFTEVEPKEKFDNLYCRTFLILEIILVNLRVTRVETLFGEMEYIEPRLKVLGIVEVGDEMTYVANEETDNV